MTLETLQGAFAALAWMLVLIVVLAVIQGVAMAAGALRRWWRS